MKVKGKRVGPPVPAPGPSASDGDGRSGMPQVPSMKRGGTMKKRGVARLHKDEKLRGKKKRGKGRAKSGRM